MVILPMKTGMGNQAMSGAMRRAFLNLRAPARETETGERGAAAMLVAISSLVIFAIMAIAIDFGFLFNERRQAQAAIDNATMAASFASCNGVSVQDAADAAITANGYTPAEMTMTKVVGTDHQYEGDLRTTVDNTFAVVIGFSANDVTAAAEADCVGLPGNGQVNAAFWSWTWIRVTGQDTRDITGGFHANGTGCDSIPCNGTETIDGITITDIYNGSDRPDGYHIHNTGQEPRFIDMVSCTATNCSGGSDPLHDGTPGGQLTIVSKTPQFPVDVEFDDYKPTGSLGTLFWCGVTSGSDADTSCAAGDSSDGDAGTYNYVDLGGTGTKQYGCPSPGVYVVNGNLEFSGDECGKSSFKNVTLIAQGWIHVDGADAYLEPFDKVRDVIVMFSESVAAPYEIVGSTKSAIHLSGQDPHLRGAVVAPYGNFGEGGQDLRDSVGVVIAESISSTGQDLRNFTFDASFLPPGGGYDVWLEE